MIVPITTYTMKTEIETSLDRKIEALEKGEYSLENARRLDHLLAIRKQLQELDTEP